jgi:hypothetical protein
MDDRAWSGISRNGAISFPVKPFGRTQELFGFGDVRRKKVRLKIGELSLNHSGQSFQPHARIDVLFGQGTKVPIFLAIKLGEHQVPHFHPTVAIVFGSAGSAGPTGAGLFPLIEEDLGTGAAGAGGTHVPKIGVGPHADNAGFWLKRFPQFKRFIVFFVNGRNESVFIDSHFFG